MLLFYPRIRTRGEDAVHWKMLQDRKPGVTQRGRLYGDFDVLCVCWVPCFFVNPG